LAEEKWSTGHKPALRDDGANVDEVISVPVVPGEGINVPDLYELDRNFVVQLFPPEEVENLPKNMKHGFAASIIIQCGKDKCPYFDACPYRDRVDEMQERCIVEMEYAIQAFTGYVKQLKVNADDLPSMVFIKDLVSIDIRLDRFRRWQQVNPGSDFQQVAASFDENGPVDWKWEAHPVHEQIDKLLKARERILDNMMGTKKSRKATAIRTAMGSRRAQEILIQQRAERMGK